MVETRQFADCVVTFDDRYAPILISVWSGRADLEAARWHTEINRAATQRLIAQGLPIVSISDALASQRPPPEVRKFWADSMNESPRDLIDATIGNIIVFGSPLMRGVLTAIGWMTEEARKITTVASLAEAIDLGLAKLDEAGVARPPGLTGSSYSLPGHDAAV